MKVALRKNKSPSHSFHHSIQSKLKCHYYQTWSLGTLSLSLHSKSPPTKFDQSKIKKVFSSSTPFQPTLQRRSYHKMTPSPSCTQSSRSFVTQIPTQSSFFYRHFPSKTISLVACPPPHFFSLSQPNFSTHRRGNLEKKHKKVLEKKKLDRSAQHQIAQENKVQQFKAMASEENIQQAEQKMEDQMDESKYVEYYEEVLEKFFDLLPTTVTHLPPPTYTSESELREEFQRKIQVLKDFKETPSPDYNIRSIPKKSSGEKKPNMTEKATQKLIQSPPFGKSNIDIMDLPDPDLRNSILSAFFSSFDQGGRGSKTEDEEDEENLSKTSESNLFNEDQVQEDESSESILKGEQKGSKESSKNKNKFDKTEKEDPKDSIKVKRVVKSAKEKAYDNIHMIPDPSHTSVSQPSPVSKKKTTPYDPSFDEISQKLLNLYRVGSPEEALSLFNKLKDPTVVEYNSVIWVCARAGQMQDCTQIFLKMKESNITPNLYTYLSMMRLHLRQPKSLLYYFKQLQNDGFIPNLLAYRLALFGSLQLEDYRKFFGLMKDMHRKGLRLTSQEYTKHLSRLPEELYSQYLPLLRHLSPNIDVVPKLAPTLLKHIHFLGNPSLSYQYLQTIDNPSPSQYMTVLRSIQFYDRPSYQPPTNHDLQIALLAYQKLLEKKTPVKFFDFYLLCKFVTRYYSPTELNQLGSLIPEKFPEILMLALSYAEFRDLKTARELLEQCPKHDSSVLDYLLLFHLHSFDESELKAEYALFKKFYRFPQSYPNLLTEDQKLTFDRLSQLASQKIH